MNRKLDDLYPIQIFDNEELEREKSVRGRAKVINEFTWSAVVDRLEGIYESIADVS
jgi:glycosyltransferase involved in cell wall biosynthesis